jgi:hypothetical protein
VPTLLNREHRIISKTVTQRWRWIRVFGVAAILSTAVWVHEQSAATAAVNCSGQAISVCIKSSPTPPLLSVQICVLASPCAATATTANHGTTTLTVQPTTTLTVQPTSTLSVQPTTTVSVQPTTTLVQDPTTTLADG